MGMVAVIAVQNCTVIPRRFREAFQQLDLEVLFSVSERENSFEAFRLQ